MKTGTKSILLTVVAGLLACMALLGWSVAKAMHAFSVEDQIRGTFCQVSSAIEKLLHIAGAIAPMAVLPSISELGWPPIIRWLVVGVELALVVYALTLLPTKLVLSEERLCQTQFRSVLKLQWRDIAEWRYIRRQDVGCFWIREQGIH